MVDFYTRFLEILLWGSSGLEEVEVPRKPEKEVTEEARPGGRSFQGRRRSRSLRA